MLKAFDKLSRVVHTCFIANVHPLTFGGKIHHEQGYKLSHIFLSFHIIQTINDNTNGKTLKTKSRSFPNLKKKIPTTTWAFPFIRENEGIPKYFG